MSNIIPTDSASVFAALDTLVSNQSKIAIVRPNNPPPGIAGFLFDIVNDDTAELESDITDHYVEDNTSIQDHIALRPETLTVSGEVAEVVRSVPVQTPAESQSNPLPLIPGFGPLLTPGAKAQQTKKQASTAASNAGIQSTKSLYGYYQAHMSQQPNQTKQSVVFGYFYQLWKGRQLFSVETPWGFFENMAILSVSAHQGPESRSISDFTITFKKIRTAQSIAIVPGQLAGRAVFQQSPSTLNGVVGQTTATTAQANRLLTPP